ncbi:MAG: phosphatidylglycerophosphatase A [Pseudomonadales bacterium]|jgi:phosphatidylglycerophosphatase A|nr:phosphatidylglycerophosphatase A [Pseudomonadales bacterium]
MSGGSEQSRPAPDLRNPVHVLAFGFGSGLSPRAPGTAGTVLAVLLYLPMISLAWPLYLVLLVISSLAGIWLCGKTSRDLGVHDHGGIVWDEFVGFWITMFLAPTGWLWLVYGFLLFRLLDIVKPWPIKWIDKKVTGGLGIMLDDVLAGIMAALCMQATRILLA